MTHGAECARGNSGSGSASASSQKRKGTNQMATKVRQLSRGENERHFLRSFARNAAARRGQFVKGRIVGLSVECVEAKREGQRHRRGISLSAARDKAAPHGGAERPQGFWLLQRRLRLRGFELLTTWNENDLLLKSAVVSKSMLGVLSSQRLESLAAETRSKRESSAGFCEPSVLSPPKAASPLLASVRCFRGAALCRALGWGRGGTGESASCWRCGREILKTSGTRERLKAKALRKLKARDTRPPGGSVPLDGETERDSLKAARELALRSKVTASEMALHKNNVCEAHPLSSVSPKFRCVPSSRETPPLDEETDSAAVPSKAPLPTAPPAPPSVQKNSRAKALPVRSTSKLSKGFAWVATWNLYSNSPGAVGLYVSCEALSVHGQQDAGRCTKSGRPSRGRRRLRRANLL